MKELLFLWIEKKNDCALRGKLIGKWFGQRGNEMAAAESWQQ